MNFFEANAQRSDETWKAYQAFCHFLNQGPDRTAAAAARYVETSPATISTWRKKHDWDARIATIDAIVQGYIANQDFEGKFQEMMELVNKNTVKIMSALEKKMEKDDLASVKYSELSQCMRTTKLGAEVFAESSWYGRVVTALKTLYQTENAQAASEQFVKEHLPKASDRTRNPDDEGTG